MHRGYPAKEMVKVAIRSPGEKPWTRKTEVLEFRTFYGVLQAMGRELLDRTLVWNQRHLMTVLREYEDF